MADAEDNTVVLTYKYRLLPTKRQHAALADILESQRILYNAALEERIDCYRKTGKGRSFIDQCKGLTELRAESDYRSVPVKLQRWTLKKLDVAYQAFFCRLDSGNNPGFPRFRGKGRWRSFGFSEFSGIRLNGNRLRFKSLPSSLRIHLHRPLPEGRPLGCTFTRDHKGWSVCLQYSVPVVNLPATGNQAGIDVGLTTLAMLSTGEAFPNPWTAKRAEREFRRRQRALARCKRGSNRRRKIRARVTRLHAEIANARQTYLHQLSARLVREHDLIAVEKLNMKGLAAGMLAKGVHDAAWSKLKEMIAYKSEKAGRRFVEVKAAGTSQTCPECGQVKAKSLAERVHRCDCGCVMDRDHAAAIVVLQRAVASPVAA
ncbi:RNA-guided endonuclease InsQ/TnpB family protein [Tundrisphaera lichenicola]|uniref:RNA-guided endonuclease InsQ/TnpB family protein n=1 Tax=Tundrisphaera lichenicola TaxID=2029860 RepID=UPI003EB8B79F